MDSVQSLCTSAPSEKKTKMVKLFFPPNLRERALGIFTPPAPLSVKKSLTISLFIPEASRRRLSGICTPEAAPPAKKSLTVSLFIPEASRKRMKEFFTSQVAVPTNKSLIVKFIIPEALRKRLSEICKPQAAQPAEESAIELSNSKAWQKRVTALSIGDSSDTSNSEDISLAPIRYRPMIPASKISMAARHNEGVLAMGRAASTIEYPVPRSRRRRLLEATQPREHCDTSVWNAGYDTSKFVLVSDKNGSEYLVPIDTVQYNDSNSVYELNADQVQTDSMRPVKGLKLDDDKDDKTKTTQLQSSDVVAEGSLDHTDDLNKEEDICMKEPSDEQAKLIIGVHPSSAWA